MEEDGDLKFGIAFVAVMSIKQLSIYLPISCQFLMGINEDYYGGGPSNSSTCNALSPSINLYVEALCGAE